MTIKQLLHWTIILATVSLASPFIWLKIGPEGYAYYGPNVPDIYILGATILGKDRSFWGIAVATTVQLIIIIYYILSTYWMAKNIHKKQLVLNYTLINLALLFLFPFWLYVYVGGVICNSDGADLSIYPHIGILIYLALLTLNISTIIKTRKLPSGNTKGS
jgi:hypothetical protein